MTPYVLSLLALEGGLVRGMEEEGGRTEGGVVDSSKQQAAAVPAWAGPMTSGRLQSWVKVLSIRMCSEVW